MQKEEIKKDVEKFADLEAVAKSKGGRRIAKGLKDDIISLISKICSLCKKGGGYNEILSAGIQLDEKLMMYNLFVNASLNLKDANIALDELLKIEKEEL